MEVDNGLPLDDFDLEAYASNYAGHIKVDRLLFVADKALGHPLELEALKMAADELKKATNTSRYREVMDRIAGRAGPAYHTDRSWVESTDAHTESAQARLESELSSSRSSLVKESIRLAHAELAELQYGRGDLVGALKNYLRTRDYASTPRHMLGTCLGVLRCALASSNYTHVLDYARKVEGLPEAQANPVAAAQLACALGLMHLDGRKYHAAARKLTEVTPDLGGAWAEVVAPRDVALAGTLCALATLSREELGSRVVHSAPFREFLDTVPEVRDAASDFLASRYARCLAHLEALRPSLALDPRLAPHAAALLGAVRRRALAEYARPFSSLRLATMATAFGTDDKGLEGELAELIESGLVAARIDAAAGVLHGRRAAPRTATYAEAMRAAEGYLRASRALLLRASMLRGDLVQRPDSGGVPDMGEAMLGGRPGRHRDRGDRTERMSAGILGLL